MHGSGGRKDKFKIGCAGSRECKLATAPQTRPLSAPPPQTIPPPFKIHRHAIWLAVGIIEIKKYQNIISAW